MAIECHALPDDRGLLNIPFPVELENCKNMEDFQTIMEHISKIMDNTEKRKGLLSVMKTEIEHFVQSTDINVLQDYLHTVIQNYCNQREPIWLFFITVYHVLVASERRNIIQILNVMKGCLGRLKSHHGMTICQLYLDMYYKDNPNEIFTNIHTIWKLDPINEFYLKLVYCANLMGAKDYKTLIQLIHDHADYFIESFELAIEHPYYCYLLDITLINVMIHILHHQASLNMMEKVKTVETIILRILKKEKSTLYKGFLDYILTIDNKQILGDPHIIKLIQHAMKEYPHDCTNVVLLCSRTLMHANLYTKKMKFNKCFSQLILSLTTNEHLTYTGCYYKKQYCMSLLILLDSYVSCHDTCNKNLVLMRLLEFRVSLLFPLDVLLCKGLRSCYCSMGKGKCEQDAGVTFIYDFFIQKQKFQRFLLNNYERKLTIDDEFDLVMENILWGKKELAPYLQKMIYKTEMNNLKERSFLFFMKIMKRTNDHNAVKLYDIIKLLCSFDLQPEIQDLILSGLTEYLIISCNRQYGMLSKFILDINMICSKGQFLQKLTSSITKVWLKFNDDTVTDIKRVIYHCYCTARHGSKNEKDANIEKYKDHYTFITSMEVEEEMEKLKNSTNVLLLLTLLLIATGGYHKSAELKKYLSLKYEYRDSIVYLLWCSGDVEVNPGPTRFTLRKLDDSEKERIWIYDMCSILVTLIKYKSFDNKNGGMWKEKPLHWPTDCIFYNPRNKPTGLGYSIDTDKKLLECLVEHCNVEEIFKATTQFADEHTKLKVMQYQKEIITWKNNRSELFEQYILRQELDALKAAKGSLHKYRKHPECNSRLYDINLKLFFSFGEDSNRSKKSYTDIVKDIAATFCRIGKGLNYLEKSDGIWKTPPRGWNPSHPYYSPCNNKKGRDKGQDDKLVDNLLTYCESNNITIPSELQPLIMAWKQGKRPEITIYYTIWSKTAIVKHSLQYLELEGMLGKIHVQESLQQIGVILDTQHWRCPCVNTSCTSDNYDKSQNTGFSGHLHSSLLSDIKTNPTAKLASLQINSDNPSTQFIDSTQTNLNDTPASSHSLDSHTDGHLCNVSPGQHQRNQSSKHTCVNSCKDSCQILTRKAQPEADVNHLPISYVNSSTSKGEVIPCTVHFHDASSKQERINNNIFNTAKKRQRQTNDTSCSEPKRLYVPDEDLPLLLNILSSPLDNDKKVLHTRPKGNSKDVSTILADHLSHDLISLETRPNSAAEPKQTDQGVVKKFLAITSDKQVDSSSSRWRDRELEISNNNKITSDQYDEYIVDLLDKWDQDYSSTSVDTPIPKSCSSAYQSSDSSNELPEHIQSYVDTYINSSNLADLL